MRWRIEIASKTLDDSHERALAAQLKSRGFDVEHVERLRVMFIESNEPRDAISRAAHLLADGVVDVVTVLSDADSPSEPGKSIIEIHPRPGVMVPASSSIELALTTIGLKHSSVRTATQFRFDKVIDDESLQMIARKFLVNPVIEEVHLGRHEPESFQSATTSALVVRKVELTEQGDSALSDISRHRHLFLNLDEMRAIRAHFRLLQREPTDIELETIAQTWSEHCIHKTMNSAVDVVHQSGQITRSYNNLIRETIFESTAQLIEKSHEDFALSVFKDNAGVIAFDETDAICVKVETHNRPSAIDPYAGASTGLGGVIRDILGSGLCAKPIAATDVFCVGFFSSRSETRNPKRMLEQITAGVRDYGNHMGIPTVNGAVYFDDSYVANPLVFCGCIGIISKNQIAKGAHWGEVIVLIGGKTGRDGIHGATFSSGHLTSNHAAEFSHAVQIGNPIEQKKMMDVLLQARDRGLFTSITDCGAGGLSSAVGEMGADVGAIVELDRVPLKYEGLRYDEIWISESQERMILSVPPAHVEPLIQLANSEDVEATAIGTFGSTERELIARFKGAEVMRLSMDFVHHGAPRNRRKASVDLTVASHDRTPTHRREADRQSLLATLAHPNIASKHAIIRQYDHEVLGSTIIKPLTGPLQIGPSDAAVIRPRSDSLRAVVIACGLQPHIDNPYEMALASIDEAIRNAVCVGADLDHLALLDNFCWPSTDDAASMGALVRACEACRDAALAYQTPFISGKDSLHNQFVDARGNVTRIRNTLLISAIGIIADFRNCLTMDLKSAGSQIILIRPRSTDPVELSEMHRAVSKLIGEGRIRAIHDVSDGGALVALAEMSIASRRGLQVDLDALAEVVDPFQSVVGHYIAEVADPRNLDLAAFADLVEIAKVTDQNALSAASKHGSWAVSIDEMTTAWRSFDL